MSEITIIPETIQIIRMSDEEYFSDKYKDYISNSRLGLLWPPSKESIDNYLEGFKGGYSPSFELGSAIHCLTLQKNDFVISPNFKPTGKLGLFAEELFKIRKNNIPLIEAIKLASEKADYYSGKLTANRLKTAISKILPFYLKRIHEKENLEKEVIYLSETMNTKLLKCMDSIESDKKIQSLLYPKGLLTPAEYYNEYAIFCEADVENDNGEYIRVKLKAKLDNFTIDHETQTVTLNDLKSSGKPVGYFMGNKAKVLNENGATIEKWIDGSFQTYHYYRQMGMYLWLLQAAVKQIYGYDYDLKANMLVVETIPHFKSRVCKITNGHIQAGVQEFKTLLLYLTEWMIKQ